MFRTSHATTYVSESTRHRISTQHHHPYHTETRKQQRPICINTSIHNAKHPPLAFPWSLLSPLTVAPLTLPPPTSIHSPSHNSQAESLHKVSPHLPTYLPTFLPSPLPHFPTSLATDKNSPSIEPAITTLAPNPLLSLQFQNPVQTSGQVRSRNAKFYFYVKQQQQQQQQQWFEIWYSCSCSYKGKVR